MATVLTRLVWYVFGLIEVLIAVRFVLKLLDANAQTPFVQLVYGFAAIFMAPFDAIFATQHFSGSRIEWSGLVAIAVYALMAWGIVSLIRVLSPRRSAETLQTVVKNDEVKAP
jgi:hypothetical protein